MRSFKENAFILLCGTMIAAAVFTTTGIKEAHAASGQLFESTYYGVTEDDGSVTLTVVLIGNTTRT